MQNPNKRENCGCLKSSSTQTCYCQCCSRSTQEVCAICGLLVPSACLSNETLTTENAQRNTCECFLSTDTVLDIAEETTKAEESSISRNEEMKSSEESLPEFSSSSNGFALSPDERSDQSLSYPRNISGSSGENSGNTYTVKGEMSVQNQNTQGNRYIVKSKDTSDDGEREYSESSTTGQESTDNPQIKKESGKSEYMKEIDNNDQCKIVPLCDDTFYFEKHAATPPSLRPILPRPFPLYNKSVTPVPVIPTAVPGRFSAPFHSIIKTRESHHPRIEGSTANLSKKLLTETKNLDPEGSKIEKAERIENWLDKVECNPPDEEEFSTYERTSPENTAECVFNLSGASTDDRSSTEISEEENLRQRLSRRPPRGGKRSKQN